MSQEEAVRLLQQAKGLQDGMQALAEREEALSYAVKRQEAERARHQAAIDEVTCTVAGYCDPPEWRHRRFTIQI